MSIDNPRDWDAALVELVDDDQPTGAPVDDPNVTAPVIRSTTRRPIVPTWLRSLTALRDTLTWLVGYAAHTAAYHAIRVPKYGGKLVLRSPRGFDRIVSGFFRWLFDWEGEPVRQDTVRRADAAEYLKLSRQRDARVRGRLLFTVFALLVLLCGGGAAWLSVDAGTRQLAYYATAVLALIVCGAAGGQQDKPLLDTAVVTTRVARLTSDTVVRALSVLGIAGINQALSKTSRAIGFPAPITRDGPGWRADVDLPPGVTAADVLDRRDRLASGLGRPIGCVWPEGAHDIHPGRLILWVGDQDMASAKPQPWPLAKTGSVDLFQPFPFGTDPRGRFASMELLFTNLLIGSIPGYGKTFALRLPLLAAALDVTAELWVYELKGTGDLESVSLVAARYASGGDDDTAEEALQALRDLRKECARRAEAIKRLPKTVCPENKVTRQLANQTGHGLHPLVVAIDECQELFSHNEYGKEAGELAEKVVKLGRALGVILLLATQRPDAKSVPTGVSANVGTRFCLRVMGQLENDMILGTSSYKNGVRASMFGPKDKGVGYLVGAGSDAQIVKTFYADALTAEKVITRARAARELAGRLTGYAAGQTAPTTTRVADTLLDDLLTVFPADDKAWNDLLCERLTALRPETYTGWKSEQLTAALKPHTAIRVHDVGRRVDGKSVTRRGIARDDLLTAVTERDRKRGNG